MPSSRPSTRTSSTGSLIKSINSLWCGCLLARPCSFDHIRAAWAVAHKLATIYHLSKQPDELRRRTPYSPPLLANG